MPNIETINRDRQRALDRADALLVAIRAIMPFDCLRAHDLALDLKAAVEKVNAIEEQMERAAESTTDLAF